jgi:predicted Zn-dependent peptidase
MAGTRTRSTRVLERGADGSVVTLSVMSGGLRVVTESVPGSRSTSVGVWVGVGSVDETPRLAGASHYLEHLLFKGTRRRTGAEIAAQVDAVGGELNAFTSHEYTCYYAHVLAEQARMAVELVCEVVLDATVSAQDVDTERSVILEEIAMRDDDPEETLADAFAAAVFQGHPVAAPVIGSEATIEAMSRTQVAGYYRRRYAPERMVVAVAGRVDHQDVVAWVRATFGDRLTDGVRPVAPREGRGVARADGRVRVVERDTEQAHICLGVPALHRNDRRRHALAVLSTALGGGMSSRLFRTIREEHGLAYSCYAATSAYSDLGSLSVYAGCQPDNLAEVTKLIGTELAQVAADGLTDEELTRAKGQLAGSLVLSLEDAESRMSRIGKNLLVRPDYLSVQHDLDAIRAVTPGQVSKLARELFARPVAGAVVGPYRGDRDLPAPLIDLVGRPVTGR